MNAPVLIRYAKRAVRTVVQQALPGVTVVWGPHPSVPRPARPFVLLGIVSGPSMDGTFKDERRIVQPLASATVTVDVATAGQTYTVRILGVPHRYVAQGGDTATVIRDALLTEIGDEGLDGFTASPSGGAGILLTPDATGTLYSVSATLGMMSVVAPLAVTSVTYIVGRRLLTVSLGFFAGDETLLETGALDMASRTLSWLSTETAMLTMQDLRVPITPMSGIAHLSGLEAGGAVMESRASFDVQVAISSMMVETAVPVEDVEVTTVISGETNTFTVSS